ncbi:MAG: tetratricopeptide repeat protein [Capsulimonadaceae bacterium]|nr:tetratricopeptide repeat protein [Capsulimonadaceae bacterium]
MDADNPGDGQHIYQDESIVTNSSHSEPALPQNADDPPAQGRDDRATPLAVLLAAITFCLFARVLRQSFVDWDDPLHVLDNPYLHPVNASHLAHFWTHAYCRLYVPVAYMLFSGLAAVGKLNAPIVDNTNWALSCSPVAFHAASLVFHIVNALLVYALMLRIVKNSWAALAGALLFALHPMQVEAVAWISELRGMLSATLALGAVNLYYRAILTSAGQSRTLRRMPYTAALVLFTLALLSKPAVVALPLAIWAMDRWIFGQRAADSLRRLAPWAVVCAPIALLTSRLQPMPLGTAAPFWQRPFDALDAIGFYAVKFVCPVRLATDYGRTPHFVATHPICIAYVAIPVAIALIVWRTRGTHQVCVAATLVSVAMLLPVIGLTPFYFQIMSTVADRYVYLAMLGPAIIAAYLLAAKPCAKTGLPFALWILLLALGASYQVRAWDNCETLYRNAILSNPETFLMRYNYGNVLNREGRYGEALEQYRAAFERKPDYAEAYSGAGNALVQMGRTSEARGMYIKALRIAPHYDVALHNLAVVNDTLSLPPGSTKH